MSAPAPPRPRATATTPAGDAGLVNPYPLRYPQTTSPAFMARRGWWLVALNFLLPGSAQALAGNKRLGRVGLGATIVLWALLAIALVLALTWRVGLFTIATNWFALVFVQFALIAYALLWVVLTIDTLRLVRLVKIPGLQRVGVAALSIVLLVVSSGTAAWAAGVVGSARDGISSIFGASGPTLPPSDGYYNILLLGADSGEGRDSMRFDSISVVSINADSGAVTITGLPRDLAHFPFSEGPMRELYPNVHEGFVDPSCGWGSGLNQLRTEVEVCRDGQALYPDAVAAGSEPGVEATKDAAEGILGIEIPYYVFIDMDGFAALIDALGGVEITVDERLPKGGGPAYEGQPADDWAIGWIETGTQRMDGDTAQWYARSRYTTSDWDRMQRQRELQGAILAQATPANVLARFQDIVAAGGHLVDTDIPQSMLGYFVDLGVSAKDQPLQTLELVPENGVDQDAPDIALVQRMLNDMLHPPEPEEDGS